MSAVRTKRPSPILGAASAMIDQASATLVTKTSRFSHTFEARLDAIEADPLQPRRVFDEEDIKSLASTMQERGQLQPILLRAHDSEQRRWVIVAGERRWRAAKLNGWDTILAIQHEGDPEIASLLENLQRIDLTPVEEARGLQRLLQEQKWTQDQAAEALAKSKGEISATLRVLTLPDDLLRAVLTSELQIPKHALVELARVDNGPARDFLISLAKKGELTVRKIRSLREDVAAQSKETLTPTPRKPKPSDTRLNISRVDKVTQDLRRVRLGKRHLAPEDRAVLVSLQVEIEEVLCSRAHDKKEVVE